MSKPKRRLKVKTTTHESFFIEQSRFNTMKGGLFHILLEEYFNKKHPHLIFCTAGRHDLLKSEKSTLGICLTHHWSEYDNKLVDIIFESFGELRYGSREDSISKSQHLLTKLKEQTSVSSKNRLHELEMILHLIIDYFREIDWLPDYLIFSKDKIYAYELKSGPNPLKKIKINQRNAIFKIMNSKLPISFCIVNSDDFIKSSFIIKKFYFT